MNTLSWIIDGSFSTRLTVALLHFLWQGFAGGILVIVGGWLLHDAAARTRYCLNVAAMLLMAACLPATFILQSSPDAVADRSASVSNLRASQASPVTHSELLDPEGQPFRSAEPGIVGLDEPLSAPGPAVETGRTPFEADSTRASSAAWLSSIATPFAANAFPTLSQWVAALYLIGVVLILGRLLRGVWGGHRLRTLSIVVKDAALLEMVRKQAYRLGLKVVPTVAWCEQVSIPVVVGIVRPMILLPMAVASGLTPLQLQALMLHELSHIRRFDPVVNLLQRIIEAMLFFHPVVWFVSRRVSIEREHAADDMVLAAGWDRPLYADALLRVAELASAISGPDAARRAAVLGVAGTNPSEFKLRILRLLGNSHPPKLDLPRSGVLVLLLLIVMGGGMLAWSQTNEHVTTGNRPDPIDKADMDPTPSQRVPGEPMAGGVRTMRKPVIVLPDHWIVTSVQFDNDGKELVSASTQSFATIRRWDLVGNQLISEIKLEGDKHGRSFREETLTLSADGRRAVAATDEYVGIWDTATGKLLNRLPIPKVVGDNDTVRILTCTPDLSLIVGSLETNFDRTSRFYDAYTVVWDGTSGRMLRTLAHKHQTRLIAISVSSDGRRFATTNGSGAAIWDTSSGQQLLHVPNDNTGRKHSDPEVASPYTNHVWSIQFSPNGKKLAIGDILGVKLVDATSGGLLRQLDAPYRYSSVQSPKLAFSKDGKLLARMGTGDKSGEPRTAYVVPIWSTHTGQKLFELHSDSNDGAFSDDGRQFAIGFSDMQSALSVWPLSGEAANGEEPKGPRPESRQDRVEENGHHHGRKTAEFIDVFKPTWGETKLGIQYGIALTKPQRQFRVGERVPLVAFLRNAADKPLKIDMSPDYFGNTPRILNATGESIKLETLNLLGTIPRYVEMLEPGEAVGPFYFNFGLGENPRIGHQHWHPYYRTPAVGPYKLEHSVWIDAVAMNDGDESKRDRISSGQIEFEIVRFDKADHESGAEDPLAPNPTAKEQPTSKGSLLFQGAWDVQRYGSLKWSAEAEEAQTWRWTIRGQEVTWTRPGKETIRLSFTVDPEFTKNSLVLRNPIEFTVLDGEDQGRKCLGIFKWEDDSLWICLQDPGTNGDRPKTMGFNGYDRQTLIQLTPALPGSESPQANQRPVPPAEDNPTLQKGLQAFQGTWRFDACESVLWYTPLSEIRDSWKWAIEGREMTWTRAGHDPVRMSIVVDPTKAPNQIDVTFLDGPDKGKTSRGIYEFERMNLWICMTEPGAEVPRPEGMEMSGSSKTALIILNRAGKNFVPVEKANESPPEPSQAAREASLLQGTLKVEQWTSEKWPAPSDKYQQWQWTVQGQEITWTRPGQERVKLSFTVDASKPLPEIDLTFLDGPDKGAKCRGVYLASRHQVAICFQDPAADVDRPKGLNSQPGSQHTAITLSPVRIPSVAEEIEALSGQWKFDIYYSNWWPARISNPPFSTKAWRWSIKGNEIAWTGMKIDDVRLSFTLDPTKSPKQIDLTILDGPYKGETLHGIYKLGFGGGLNICVADPNAGVDRPTDFGYSTNSGHTWLSMDRLAGE